MFDAPPTDLAISSGLSSTSCVVEAAARYKVPADLMFAVRSIERGAPLAPTKNTNGTLDHNEPGLNDKTLSDLATSGWDTARLKTDGCYAMNAASAWMAHKATMPRFLDTPAFQRAALYHSATEQFNLEYQRKLVRPVANWACYLHHFLKLPVEQLFAYQSGLMNHADFTNLCIEPNNARTK